MVSWRSRTLSAPRRWFLLGLLEWCHRRSTIVRMAMPSIYQLWRHQAWRLSLLKEGGPGPWEILEYQISKYSFHNELSSLPDPVSEPTGVFHENWCTLTSSMLRSSYFHLSTPLTRRQMITYIFPLLLSSLFQNSLLCHCRAPIASFSPLFCRLISLLEMPSYTTPIGKYNNSGPK